MSEEMAERDTDLKRKIAFKKRSGGHMKKRKRNENMINHDNHKVKKMDWRSKKLFQKRAREYNSDDEDDDRDNVEEELARSTGTEFVDDQGEREEKNVVDEKKDEDEEDEEGAIQPGIMRFSEGCNAFRLAFKKIIKKSVADNYVLGPVLYAHKKLVAEKLAEDDEGHKVKSEAKKEKHRAQEQGHVMPENYLDLHEKFLIGVATRGVVKLFNAVNKAQHAQKGLNPSSFKDEREIRKRRKQAFFSELGKKPSAPTGTSAKAGSSTNSGNGDGPSWAPLRDNYMLTNPKMKDWDKKPVNKADNDFGGKTVMDTNTSSDDE